MRSKAVWGYSDAFMAACRDELSYTAAAVAAGDFTVAEVRTAVAGFYALGVEDRTTRSLDAMFVAPEWIGHGLGRRLLADAVSRARAAAASRLLIEADPHAEGFYLAAGARRIGTRPSGSIAGRELPLLELTLTARP
ncbi:MAG: GNAT family N-acetyltransferase [Ectothiorhodospiraceae bacterium]|nr:GNAT family N-acetyltransferase [Chromatiales bacterium]MCP5153706.1 GNAT family N-acetyltransferase [Ectothiorhodospiraceae bacterium]